MPSHPYLLLPVVSALLSATLSSVVSTLALQACSSAPAGARIPDARDCQKYYSCLGTNAAGFTDFCPLNLMLDPVKLRCVLPSQMPPSAPCLQNGCVGKPDGTYLAHPADCRKYSICVGGVASEKTCGTLLFDIDTSKCVPNMYLESGNSCTGQPDGVHLGSPDFECAEYIVCEGERGPLEFCPNETVYNPFTQKCVSKKDAPLNHCMYECKDQI